MCSKVFLAILPSVVILCNLCFGQGESEKGNKSKIALGVIGGLNYLIYTDDD